MIDEAVYSPIITAIFTFLFGRFLFIGFLSGKMTFGHFGFCVSGNRRVEPGKFWAATVRNAIPFALVMVATVSMVVWPRGIGS